MRHSFIEECIHPIRKLGDIISAGLSRPAESARIGWAAAQHLDLLMDRFMECEAEFNGTFDEPLCCILGANDTPESQAPSLVSQPMAFLSGEHP